MGNKPMYSKVKLPVPANILTTIMALSNAVPTPFQQSYVRLQPTEEGWNVKYIFWDECD